MLARPVQVAPGVETLKKKPCVFLVAGEVSGDMHAAQLAERIKHYLPDVELRAMGGVCLRQMGAEVAFDLTARSTIGFAEVLQHFLPIYRTFLRLKRTLLDLKPDLVVLVDYQGFNMHVAKLLKQNKIPVFYYIAPQEWMWGTHEGGLRVVANTDRIFTIFKDEDEFYKGLCNHVEFIGHPLLDIVKPVDVPAFTRDYRIQASERVVGLFPGSRRQEITRLMPLIFKAAKIVSQKTPGVRFFVPVTAGYREAIKMALEQFDLKAELLPFEQRYDLMARSQAAMAISGTVTLELSILEVPMVITYAISPLSYWIARSLMKIKVRHVGLPNIVANMQIVPEFVQQQATPEKLARELQDLLQNPTRCERMRSNLRTVKRKLGEPGAIDKAARSIYTFLRS